MLVVRSVAALASLLIVTTVLGAAADVNGDTKKILTANYLLYCTALFNLSDANRNAVSSFLSPEFVGIGISGRQFGREDFFDQTQQQLSKIRVTACYYTFKSFNQPDPGAIVVTSVLHLEAAARQPGTRHSLSVIEQSQDTWIPGEKWVLRLSAVSRILVKLDGAVVQDAGS